MRLKNDEVLWRVRGNLIPRWERQRRKKVKKEYKRAVRVKGYDGLFVILNDDITGKTVKVKRIGTGEAFYVRKELVEKNI